MTTTDIDQIASCLYEASGAPGCFSCAPGRVKSFYRRLSRAVLSRFRVDEFSMTA